MIKIISGPVDLKGFDQEQFYRVYDIGVLNAGTAMVPELVALATTVGEAMDAREMLGDLAKWKRAYHITPPVKQAN